ncbi:MAG: MMPL family transporter [Candidatus Eisenbacteria sp.]|nr:MMPL family transporter [Candidatus Eisenbacteria bacterium]
MNHADRQWARKLAVATVRRPIPILLGVVAVTVLAMGLSSSLEMRMNWMDLLPSSSPDVLAYREIQERFGDPNIIVALEGERDQIVAMAEDLVPRLEALEMLYNVQGRLPLDYFLRHGMLLRKPGQFDRALRASADPSLLGTFRGLNDDYEREYADSEANLRRDEIDITRSLLGLNHALETLETLLSGQGNASMIDEAVQALLIGEPWILSLDRRMLLIACTPVAQFTDFEAILTTVEKVEELVADVAKSHPDVEANLTGMGKIAQDEMNSISTSTHLLSLLALILIYLLLARSFRGWLMPLIALAPLVVGIIWTLGLMRIVCGSLNIFTAMMGLVLLGLGIDFAIHLISRFYEERNKGAGIELAAERMIGRTGAGVLSGALTTSAAFFALMVAGTNGVYEFGFAAGSGVVLTLMSVFLILPTLLALHERSVERRRAKRGKEGAAPAMPPAIHSAQVQGGWPLLGTLASWSWRAHIAVLAAFVLLMGASFWAALQTSFEYDFLELEPAGLKSVELEREIPERFGTSNQAAWVIAETVEESRQLKESLRKKPMVAEVYAISDLLPPPERYEDYEPRLTAFRSHLAASEAGPWKPENAASLDAEINRLWDNLDLMGNLAFQSGLDRIVGAIDALTGYESETDATDSTAILPSLTRLLTHGIDPTTAVSVAEAWQTKMRSTLIAMADPSPLELDDIPEVMRRVHQPRAGGSGFLVQIIPRKYLYDKAALDRFVEQTSTVDASIVGTPQLFLLMIQETLRDGRSGAFLALLVIIVIVLLHFRGPIGLLATIPLIGGMFFMLGVMHLVGMKYNYVNMIAVPIILGIGIDDGVHALHRFREEAGPYHERIFTAYRHVGRAILLTSLTTMIGFGSVACYAYRGMASFGYVLLIGVGLCFLTTVFVLPAVLRLFAPRGRRKTTSVS